MQNSVLIKTMLFQAKIKLEQISTACGEGAIISQCRR